MRLRALKVARDLFFARGRVAIMIVALAAGVTAVGAVTGAREIVQREMRVSYLGTHPASATLAIPGGAGAGALRTARSRPGVLDAALRARAGARMTLPTGRRVPLLLFIAPARDPMTVAGFTPERGHWPPADGEVLLERSSLEPFGLRPNDRVELETPDGGRATVRVGGVVRDGAVSPSSQEGAAYGYATPALLARLGRAPVLDLLKIVVGERGQPSERRARIEAVAADVGMTLRARGVAVTRIDVPPPLRHPHQSQMETATSLLMTFSAIALVLAAILTAAMLGTILAQHAWQIGVMKTLGAGDSALFGMYLAMTLAIALAATVLALGPAAFAARYLATVVSGLFGIGLSSLDVPWRVAATEVVAGVVLPVEQEHEQREDRRGSDPPRPRGLPHEVNDSSRQRQGNRH